MKLCLMQFEQFPHGIEFEFAVCKQSACAAFELTRDLRIIDELDLLNQPVDSQANRGVAHAVFGRDGLQRPGRENEPLEEVDVFVRQLIQPVTRRCRTSE